MNRTRLVIGLLLLAGGSLSAQSFAPYTKAKDAAHRAVDATNKHTEAMTTEPGTPAPSNDQSAKKAPASADSVRKDTTGRATQTAGGNAAVRPTVEAHGFEREVFTYAPEGRRDPFISLMSTGELRPVFTDLVIDGIVYDVNGRNSVAILHDVSTKEQYRARIGATLGRMRVSRIDPKSVTFTIEEFGYSRQETLSFGDTNKERKQ